MLVKQTDDDIYGGIFFFSFFFSFERRVEEGTWRGWTEASGGGAW